MKKFLLTFMLLLFATQSYFAQKDTEFWIAPYYSGDSGYLNRLYISTDQVTPFPVKIYSNNVVIATVMVSKGNPVTYPDASASTAANTTFKNLVSIPNVPNDAFKVLNTKGLYLQGEKAFFCSLRAAHTSHGEIITAKGRAAIGKKFNVVYTPCYSATMRFTAGLMATEDNTVVTVKWTGTTPTTFYGATGPNNGAGANSHVFTFNKGQTFTFAGSMPAVPSTTHLQPAGFNGATIEATKPITLTNGNANGNFGYVSLGGEDLIMDQSVPVERLGSTFAMVKSLSTVPAENLEGAMICATEDDTEVYLNGNPIPEITLQKGQVYRILENKYIQSNTHKNMYISATKNIYVYQLIGRDNSNTGGWNYIPPLSCFLPRVIDEIGMINVMPGITSNIELKLNILTEAGATVKVNDAPLPQSQANPLQGTAAWVTYAVDNVAGELKIESDKAVTAGVNGGYSTAGYGGYFAGFSSVPLVQKVSGTCVPGIKIEMGENYDTYKWYVNGTLIPNATTKTFTPPQAGTYTCVVTMGTCPPVISESYKVFKCLVETTKSQNVNCQFGIVPTFTDSTQTPIPGSTTILTQPLHGTATINPTTGVITYVPNPSYQGPDKIVYKFCGTSTDPEFSECEQVTLNLNVFPFRGNDVTLNACQYNGKGTFDLTAAQTQGNASYQVKYYYATQADLNAGNPQISNPAAYVSGPGVVYVKIITAEGCIATAKITLVLNPIPAVNDGVLTACFIEGDEYRGEFNLTTPSLLVGGTPSNRIYYSTLADATNGVNAIADPQHYIAVSGYAYVRVFDAKGCYSIAKIKLNVTPPHPSEVLKDKLVCVDGTILLDAGPGYQSYEWSTGATTQSITVGIGEYWVKMRYNGCITKQKVTVLQAADPVIASIEITNDKATVIAKGGKEPYKYAIDNTTNWQDSNVFTNLTRGVHTFYVKDDYACEPVSVSITIPNLINAITPNGDNVNDYLDYSALANKENLEFNIYDRYGTRIYKGERFNNYRWDGKVADKPLPTGTYWYEVHWNESDKDKTPIKYNGWILIKHRE